MTPEQAAQLREILERVDARLLRLLTDPGAMDDERLAEIARLETARGAAQRLLNGAG